MSETEKPMRSEDLTKSNSRYVIYTFDLTTPLATEGRLGLISLEFELTLKDIYEFCKDNNEDIDWDTFRITSSRNEEQELMYINVHWKKADKDS